jgi:hypothetical protein
MKLKLLIAGVAVATSVASFANATNFFFSFTNNPGLGNVAGTVSGEIFGLTNNATSAATSVVVDSVPSGLDGLPATPFTAAAYASQLGEFISSNSFTVVNDVVTAADYQIWGGDFELNAGGALNSLSSPDASMRVQNLDGLGGITFSVASAAPEPAAWAMMVLGIGAIGGAMRSTRGKSRTLAAAA